MMIDIEEMVKQLGEQRREIEDMKKEIEDKFYIQITDEQIDYEGTLSSILVGLCVLVNSLVEEQGVKEETIREVVEIALKSRGGEDE